MGDEEKELAGLALAGDREAFDRLEGRYRDRLIRFCHRFLGSRAEAEDAVQEMFVRAWLYRSSFKAGQEVKPWLYQIARRECMRRLAGGRDAAAQPLESLPERADPDASVEARAIAREELGAALSRLDALGRILVHRRLELRESWAEIVHDLGGSEPMLKSRYRRALLLLRSLLQPADGAVADDSDPDADDASGRRDGEY